MTDGTTDTLYDYYENTFTLLLTVKMGMLRILSIAMYNCLLTRIIWPLRPRPLR